MVQNKECCSAWLKLEKSGYGWFAVAHIFFGGEGGDGGNSTFSAKQCCVEKVFFSYSRKGFELSFYFKNSFMSY